MVVDDDDDNIYPSHPNDQIVPPLVFFVLPTEIQRDLFMCAVFVCYLGMV